jgi:hypothetical protein
VSEIADEFETEREYMFRDTRSAQRKRLSPSRPRSSRTTTPKSI